MSGGEVRYAIVDGWLVEDVGEHTCGTGPSGYYGAHEPSCGLVPMVEIPSAVLDAAREVFTDDGTAIWLTHRNRHLDGRTPLDVISDGDTERVLDYLAALAGGPRAGDGRGHDGRVRTAVADAAGPDAPEGRRQHVGRVRAPGEGQAPRGAAMTWGQVKTFAYGTVVVVLDALLGWAIDACHRQSRRGR